VSTADQIVARVLVRCGWGSSGNPVSDAEILALADDEITSALWPQLHSAQGDWHLATKDHAITSGQALYRLPASAWGPIKDLLFVDSSEACSVPVVNVEELGHMAASGGPVSRSPYFAYVDGDSVGLHPIPASTSGTLRIRYYRQPSTLCLVAAARRITSIVDKQTYTISSPIGTFDGARVDFIGIGVAHQIISAEQLVTSVVSTSMEMDTSVPESVEVGDWVSLSGTTPVAQIPDHMVPQLVQRVAMQCLSSHGDNDGFKRASMMAADLERRGIPTIDPRNEAEPRVIMPRGSILRRGR